MTKLTQPLHVTFRQGGERCRPAGSKISRSLKKMLQALDIPSWERSSLPLFYHGESLVAVANQFVCEGWQVDTPEATGWVIEKKSSLKA